MALRSLIGEALRQRRVGQGRTLRQVSADARVSLGYISEIERGQKEASSEMLAALCGALRVPMSAVLREVSDRLLVEETRAARAQERVLTLASAPASSARPEPHGGDVVAAA